MEFGRVGETPIYIHPTPEEELHTLTDKGVIIEVSLGDFPIVGADRGVRPDRADVSGILKGETVYRKIVAKDTWLNLLSAPGANRRFEKGYKRAVEEALRALGEDV